MNQEDPYVVTYFFEECSDAAERWHSLETGAAAAARLSAEWLLSRYHKRGAPLEEWLASGYRKHARRIKSKDLAKLIDAFSGVVVETPHGRVFASELYRVSELPSSFKREQLSNFKVKESEVLSEDAPVLITINEALGMSFGKAVVAASHSAQNLILELLDRGREDAVSSWAEQDFSANVVIASLPRGLVEGDYAKVEDFGLTEVPEGSITAIAQLR